MLKLISFLYNDMKEEGKKKKKAREVHLKRRTLMFENGIKEK